jgi:hypothetical protein
MPETVRVAVGWSLPADRTHGRGQTDCQLAAIDYGKERSIEGSNLSSSFAMRLRLTPLLPAVHSAHPKSITLALSDKMDPCIHRPGNEAELKCAG